jgi:hypothetical protein
MSGSTGWSNRAEGEEMRRPKISTPEPPLSPPVDVPFLVSADELRDRKIKRRARSEAIRRLVELGLKAKK